MKSSVHPLFSLLVLVALSGCEVVDRVRGAAGGDDADASATASGLTLALQTPGMMRAGT